MTRVLLVSTDIVGPAMAGPGIRAYELANLLAQTHTVTLAIPSNSEQATAAYHVIRYQYGQAGALAAALAEADVLVGQGFVFEQHPELLATTKPIAIDLYDPLLLENLNLLAYTDPELAMAQAIRCVNLTEAQLRRGDFFFCATERQRDYWLGALSAIGRLSPQLLATSDRALRSLIDLVPSGIAAQPPTRGAPVLRGVHPAIPSDALLLIWAGGLWDWFDPQIIVRAVAALRHDCPQLRLCIFAGARPNPDGAPFTTPTAAAVRSLAAELGVLDQSVIMLDTWIPYAERGRYLIEADLGVSAHLPGIETRFAFRTRLLDYLWACLPMLISNDDSLGKQITQAGAGLGVAPGDLAAWVDNLRQLYSNSTQRASMAAAVAQLAQSYTWATVAQPLVDFCAAPRRTEAALQITPLSTSLPALAESQAYATRIEALLAVKDRHIAELEALLRRIEHGRLMRLLRAFSRRK